MVIALRAATAAEDIILAGTLMYLVLREGIPEFHRQVEFGPPKP